MGKNTIYPPKIRINCINQKSSINNIMAIAMIASIFEIWETVLAVLLLLGISTGIMLVYSPDLIHTKTLNNELAYIASIKGDKKYQIALNIEDADKITIKNNKNENKIILKVGDKTSTKSYIGRNIEITKKGSQIIIS